MRTRTCAVLLFVTAIFQHFQFASLAGYPLTVGGLTGLLLVARLFDRDKIGHILTGVVGIATLACLSALLSPGYLLPQEFPRTLALFLMAAAVVTAGFHAPTTDVLASTAVSRAALTALSIVVALSLLQVITGSNDSVAFYNVFGNHQYLYQHDPLLQFNDVPRAQGFYLEPSYNAFIIGSLTMMLVVVGRYFTWALALGAVGLIATGSATGLILFGALILLVALLRGVKSLIAASVGLFVLYLVVGQTLGKRVSSIGTTGSSANYRLKAPLTVMNNVLEEHVLGFPLGSLDKVMATYDFANGATLGTSLDNGFYVIVFQFGWIGLIAILVGTATAVGAARRAHTTSPDGTAHPYLFLYPPWILGTLVFSGGIMLPEFAGMTAFSLMLFNTLARQKERQPRDPVAERHQRDLPGRSGNLVDTGVTPTPTRVSR